MSIYCLSFLSNTPLKLYENTELSMNNKDTVTHMEELTELDVVDGALSLLPEIHLDKVAVEVEGHFLVKRRLFDHLHELLCNASMRVNSSHSFINSITGKTSI